MIALITTSIDCFMKTFRISTNLEFAKLFSVSIQASLCLVWKRTLYKKHIRCLLITQLTFTCSKATIETLDEVLLILWMLPIKFWKNFASKELLYQELVALSIIFSTKFWKSSVKNFKVYPYVNTFRIITMPILEQIQHSRHLLVQSQQCQRQNNVWNLFSVRKPEQCQ